VSTPVERAETIAVLAGLAQSDHIQELIVQNFRAKAGTRMADSPEPTMEELLRACAAMRIAAGPRVNIQAPPNLAPDDYGLLLKAGINDWGGISPVTMDYVNPEAPWPQLRFLEAATAAGGAQLVPRLCVYPEYIRDFDSALRWLDPSVLRHVLAAADAEGLSRSGSWWPGAGLPLPRGPGRPAPTPPVIAALHRAEIGEKLEETEIETLFTARGEEVSRLAELADAVRREVNGEVVTYVVTRNINYTNICYVQVPVLRLQQGQDVGGSAWEAGAAIGPRGRRPLPRG